MEEKVRKKRKLEESEDVEDEQIAKKQKLFCAEKFRKELNQLNLVASLKEFLNLAEQENNGHIVTEYLEAGGSVQEMLLLLDKTARSDLTSAVPVFRVIHLIFLSIKGKDSVFYPQAEDGAKFMLDSLIPTIEAMLNINSNKPRKAVLKVLTSVVTLFPSFGKEIMNLIPSTPTVLSQLLRPQSGSDSVRKWFIFFILSFMLSGNFSLIRSLMSMKGLLSDIMLDLKTDEAQTIAMFLSVVKEKVLENVKINKTLKLKVFYTQVIVALFEIYRWKESKPSLSSKKVIKERVVDKDEKEMVTESVHSFLLVLCASKKFGVAFSDTTFGATKEGRNNLLFSVLQSISEPWENKRMSDAVIAIVQECPDLMRVTLSKAEAVMQPRESKKWITLMQFVENLLGAISPRDALKTALEDPEMDLVRSAKQLCTPMQLIGHMSAGVRKKSSLKILYYSMRVLTLLWRKTNDVLMAFEGQQKLKKPLTRAYANCFLEFDEILEIWESVCQAPSLFESVEKQLFLNVILDYLEIGSKFEEDALDSPSRISVRMLDALDGIKEVLGDTDYLIIQSRIFYMVIAVDPGSVTPDTELFKKAVTLLLANNSKTAIESVTKIVLSSRIFENNESEIDIWMACYFDRFEHYQESIPGFFTDCLTRLYLKQVDSSREETENRIERLNGDLSATQKDKRTRKQPSPMLGEFLEMLKGQSKVKSARDYVSRVTLRLYHFYDNSEKLLKLCRGYKKEIADVILTYINNGNFEEFVADGSEFLTEVEKTLSTWIVKRKKQLNLESVFDMENTYNFVLLLPFNTMTSYLISRVRKNCLTDDGITKLNIFFSFFMGLGTGDSGQSSPLSLNVENLCFLRVKCIHHFFSLPLMDKFDVSERENETIVNFTKLIIGVLTSVSEKDLRESAVFRPWKQKILENIRISLSDAKKSIQIFGSLEVLDRFSYTSAEVVKVIREYSKVTDMKRFVDNGQVTISTLILAKFVKLQCEFAEISEKTVKLLIRIMEKMMEEEANDFGVIDDCFIHLLKNRPNTLTHVNHDFLETLLRRSDSGDGAITLGKLLLSDPAKVRHFIKFARKNFKSFKRKKTTVAMLSALVVEQKDPFLTLLRIRKFCRFWRESELIGKTEKSKKILKLMAVIYMKYKKAISMEKSRNSEFVLENERFFSVLAKCFLDKESLSNMKANIVKGSFLPEIIHETVLKHIDEDDIMETYARGLLSICSKKLKEADTCDEEAWYKYGKYMCDVVEQKKVCNWNDVSKSAIWKDFVRLSLRICFNFPNCPSLLKTIRHFVELLYAPEDNAQDVENIFNMLISHSQFLSVMLQESPLKRELVRLYYSLIKRNSKVLSLKHIPVLLASYTGSLSENDVIILNILRFYEEHNLNMNEYEPVIWGEPAVTHYSVKSNVGMSLWRRITMMNVLEMLDSKRMDVSLREFPVTRSGKVDENVSYNEKVYDPAFLLPIFANLLSPGAVTYCLPFVQRGCFAYTICALSSTSKEIRVTASVVLARLYNHLELVQTMKLKSVWLHFINCLRYAVEDIEAEPVPSVVTYFLGKTSLELSGEPGDMYTSLQKFLLAKPVFNFQYIPEFLPLFHSSDVNYMKHRRWILEILRDGFKQNNDLNLLFQTMVVKIILSYFRSQFCTRELKPIVLEVVTNVVLKAYKSKLLISEYGLLTWLNGISTNCEKELFPPFVKLLSATTTVTKRMLVSKKFGKGNLYYPTQILNILMKILPNLSECRSVPTIELYLTILLDSLLVMFKLKQRNWCKLNRSKLTELSSVVERISGKRGLADKYTKSELFNCFCDVTNNSESLYRRIAFVWNVLSRKVSG